jgi:hypothetical protein
MTTILPTTLVGSYPQPDWLIDRARTRRPFPTASSCQGALQSARKLRFEISNSTPFSMICASRQRPRPGRRPEAIIGLERFGSTARTGARCLDPRKPVYLSRYVCCRRNCCMRQSGISARFLGQNRMDNLPKVRNQLSALSALAVDWLDAILRERARGILK